MSQRRQRSMRRSGLLAGTILTAVLALALSGCERDERPTPTSKPAQPATVATQPTADELANIRAFVQEKSPREPEGLPAGHPPIEGMMPQTLPAEVTSPRAAPSELKYTAPAVWQREPVKSQMRVDQYRLPRAEGDREDGELAVTTNIGGGIEANIGRWRSQFSTAEGQPIPDSAFKSETIDADGLKIVFVDITGRFNAGATMPGGDATPKDNYRMLAAIVETPNGPWFFKALGPNATMVKHRDEFVEFLHTMTPK